MEYCWCVYEVVRTDLVRTDGHVLFDLAELLCVYDFPWASEISLLRFPGLVKALSWEQDRLDLDAL